MSKYTFLDKKGNINSHRNKGMTFETMINETNHFYNIKNIALITKRTTPIKIIETNSNKFINKAIFEKDSTTDYNGIYKGKYIDFEAKTTESNSSFSLSNIKKHQIDHLNKVEELGGISFLLIYFKNLDKIYLLKIKDLVKFINENNRKSIPLEYFDNKCFKINNNVGAIVDYLENLEKIFNF